MLAVTVFTAASWASGDLRFLADPTLLTSVAAALVVSPLTPPNACIKSVSAGCGRFAVASAADSCATEFDLTSE
jgi:hypothetical protein